MTGIVSISMGSIASGIQALLSKESKATYPLKILVLSDGDKLKFISRDAKGLLFYEYTKSSEKKGLSLPITLEQLNVNLKKGIFKEI